VHIVFVNLWHPPGIADPASLIAADAPRRGFAEALVARGHRVTVVQEAPWRATEAHAGVVWELVPPSSITYAFRRTFAAAGHPAPNVPAPATAPVAHVLRLRPDVIHSFDLVFYPSLLLLRRAADQLGVPLFAHFHGGAPARWPGYTAIARRALRGTGLVFTDRERGEQWVRAGLARPEQVHLVNETSTEIRASGAARSAGPVSTGAVFLSAGRLDAVKDPLTTVAGFHRIASALPDARFALAWTEAPLLAEVRRAAEGLPIRWLGRVAPDRMGEVLDAADYLVQSSIREVCGRVVVEALAVGTWPVVTDIAPLRRLTDRGRVGALFPVGDADALAAAAINAARGDRPGQRASARAWFEACLSYAALAAELERLYAAHAPVSSGR
jgi:glycosyltransferase involved in cell wall biosynthesis